MFQTLCEASSNTFGLSAWRTRTRNQKSKVKSTDSCLRAITQMTVRFDLNCRFLNLLLRTKFCYECLLCKMFQQFLIHDLSKSLFNFSLMVFPLRSWLSEKIDRAASSSDHQIWCAKTFAFRDFSAVLLLSNAINTKDAGFNRLKAFQSQDFFKSKFLRKIF
jgi:hypothetical protein